MTYSPSTRARLRVAAANGVPAVTGPELFDASLAPRTALELLDEETRLLAQATGEHLPLELALRVEQLRAQRAALNPGA